ncbi:hypothetical protein BDA99DRAFT_540771 [Phascolomyces articulosus]|uniref:Heterokaryon incompatibility domain-containing protein n=1 Tax=Phascolomyces articulosus TaxID=60185 RepID=A0AAD5JTT7_9FUNG|nr:hypothetical protein BDA99DRAFT_540771 [Phascolomyces articulosus]
MWNDTLTVAKTSKVTIQTKKVPNELLKPGFMPVKLVCISDMQVVNGPQVNEGYCALSYCWNQPGDILLDEDTGNPKRVDEGKHKIIHRLLYINATKYVKFEDFIQQICDNEEKKREIRNMHHIYENAYCTIALVSEYKCGYLSYTTTQEYFNCLWTLGEAIKSKRLLFVGKNKHQWGEDIGEPNGVNMLIKPKSEFNVSQILYYAHQRTSSKNHDRVFALIQLFPEFTDRISFDYDQSFEDLMIQFYGLLAKKDIGILFFRRIRNDYKSTIQKYKFLPSWAGVHGGHFYDNATSFQNYGIIGNTMHVTSTYVTNDQSIDGDTLTLLKEDLPLSPDNINCGDNKYFYLLCISVQLNGTKRIILSYRYNHIFVKKKIFR